MEILLGRKKADWRRRDRWALRLLVGGMGLFSFQALKGILILLHGVYGTPPSVFLTLWGVLWTLGLLVVVERRIRPTALSDGPTPT